MSDRVLSSLAANSSTLASPSGLNRMVTASRGGFFAMGT